MFHRLYLQGDAVVALPRPGTKTAGPVAFELSGGRERYLATRAADAAPGDGEQVRLEYLNAPVNLVTPPHTPVPFSPALEDFYVATPDRVIEAVLNLIPWLHTIRPPLALVGIQPEFGNDIPAMWGDTQRALFQ